MTGETLGHYRVGESLGRGGMGEVFRANDLSLGRNVALKFLPELFASDAERMARFEREARLMASLNHTNIAAIYGLEGVEGKRFLVLECVEGETLAQKIGRGPLPVEDALDVCRQIAEGVEAAHNSGVIHRDLKPANVKITPEGKVKVLDFGLAKALADDIHALSTSDSFTLSGTMTRPGIVLGTAAYMSPEQAKGRAIDKRTDIWALGCILYECLTGKRAFAGETIAETLGAVLKDEPDWEALPESTPPVIRRLLRRCLQKDPSRRLQDAGDLRIEIDESQIVPQSSASVPSPTRRNLNGAFLFGVSMLILGAVIAAFALRYFKTPAPGKIVRTYFVMPEDQRFTNTGRALVDISPDGGSFVYVANSQLYLRRLSEMESRPVAGTFEGISSPVFSPDGQWIGFYSVGDGALKKIAATGGATVTLCRASLPYGVSWRGDTLVFGQGPAGILAVSASGGTPEAWVKLQPGEVASSPEILPSGDAVLFAVFKSSTSRSASFVWDRADIEVYSRKTGQRKVLVQGGSAPHYVPSGHLIYALGPNLMMVPMNLEHLEVTGGPIPILEGVMRASGQGTDAADFAFSEDGTLLYIPGGLATAMNRHVLALVDRSGKREVLGVPPGAYEIPRLSRDGKQLAVVTSDEGISIWIYELSGKSALRRLTFDGSSTYPLWSPDSRQIAYYSNRDNKPGIFLQAADGSGTAERVTNLPPGQSLIPNSWSPDGRTLAISASAAGNDYGVWTAPLGGGGKPELFYDVPASVQASAAFSPDGRWLAYVSSESGNKNLVYVNPFPRTGSARYQVSRENGIAPLWSPDGKELFYYQPDLRRLVAVPVQSQSALSFGQPVPLPIEDIYQPTGSRQYDVTPDGKRFLVTLEETQPGEQRRPNQQINLVFNWFEELRQRFPAK
jgi:serine/threonine protein kinase/Tol biopolymer transport system component